MKRDAFRHAAHKMSFIVSCPVVFVAVSTIITGVFAPFGEAQEFHLWLEAEKFACEQADFLSVRSAPPYMRPTPPTQLFSNEEVLVLRACSAARSAAIPVAGTWAVWVRYVQRVGRDAAFELRIEQDTVGQWKGTYGESPIVRSDDEMLLRFGWTCVWERHYAALRQGSARLTLSCSERAEAEIDCIMLTADADFHPVGLQLPRFDYLRLCEEWSVLRADLQPLCSPQFRTPLPTQPAFASAVRLKGDVLDIGLLAAFARGTGRSGGSGRAFQLPPPLEQPSAGWRRKALLALALARAGRLSRSQRSLAPPLAETIAWLDELGDPGEPLTPLVLLVDASTSAVFEHQNRIPPSRMLSSTLKVLRYPVARAACRHAGSESRTFVPAPLGDMFDVVPITEDIGSAHLTAYRVLVVGTDMPLGPTALAALLTLPHSGATIVLNIAHLDRYPDPDQFGIVRTGVRRTASLARCAIDGAVFTGSPFEYELAVPQGSRVLLETQDGEPLAVSTPLADGQMIVILIPYGEGLDEQPSAAWTHLLHHLASGLLPLQVVRGEVQWWVNRIEGIWRAVLIAPSDGPGMGHQVQLLARMLVKRSLERISGQPILWRTDGNLSRAGILIGPSGVAVVDVIE